MLQRGILNTYIFVILSLIICSCGAYKQNVMFRTDGSPNSANVNNAIAQAESNYLIQVNDQVEVEVYTNEGELIIDPNMELRKDLGTQQTQGGKVLKPNYKVYPDGTIRLPMVGTVHVINNTVRQVDSLLEKEFNKYYESVFVLTKVTNKRVIVIGPKGGVVVPLLYENMNLIEIIALYGGMDNNSKAHNIRLVRGDLKSPEVQVVDLSTIDGLKKASLQVYPNDIVYIEPVRKVVSESVRDITPIVSMFTSLITLIIVINR